MTLTSVELVGAELAQGGFAGGGISTVWAPIEIGIAVRTESVPMSVVFTM